MIEQNVRQGERTPQLRFTLTSLKPPRVQGNTASAEVVYDVSDYDVITRSGTVKTHIPADTSHFDLFLAKTSNGWIISNFMDLES